MKKVKVAFILLAAVFFAAPLKGSEEEAQSRIVSVGLFKNGLVLVNRVVEVPGGGTYVIRDVPEPVHGSFWVQSTAEVSVRATRGERERTLDLKDSKEKGFQETLAGREVEILFAGGELPPVIGRVEALPRPDRVDKPGSDLWTAPDPYYRYNPYTPPREARFLLLSTSDGLTFVDSSRIACLRVKGGGVTVKESVPLLLVEVEGKADEPSALMISYLAKGLSWAPSYRIGLTDSKRLEIEQKAVVRNELEDLHEAEVFLISGFPSVEFAHVKSPFASETDWAAFFRALSREPSRMHHLGSNVVAQQAVMIHGSGGGDSIDLSAVPLGDGVDLHYQPLGRLSLSRGDSLIRSVAAGDASYERIVEWIVPDNRDPHGRYISDSERRNNPDKYKDSAWDALLFRNPFSFPMTTAPAMVAAGDRFLGQRTAFWTNAGERTTLHVNKALSIRTLSSEQEDREKRKVLYIGGDDYQETKVTGSLRAANHRAESVKLVIRRRFSGELISAEGDPESVLREEGVYSINQRNELIWTITLEPGEERELAYRYSVLVDI